MPAFSYMITFSAPRLDESALRETIEGATGVKGVSIVRRESPDVAGALEDAILGSTKAHGFSTVADVVDAMVLEEGLDEVGRKQRRRDVRAAVAAMVKRGVLARAGRDGFHDPQRPPPTRNGRARTSRPEIPAARGNGSSRGSRDMSGVRKKAGEPGEIDAGEGGACPSGLARAVLAALPDAGWVAGPSLAKAVGAEISSVRAAGLDLAAAGLVEHRVLDRLDALRLEPGGAALREELAVATVVPRAQPDSATALIGKRLATIASALARADARSGPATARQMDAALDAAGVRAAGGSRSRLSRLLGDLRRLGVVEGERCRLTAFGSEILSNGAAARS